MIGTVDEGTQRLRAALSAEHAAIFAYGRLGVLLDDGGKAEARAAELALAVIAEHPTDLVRDQYVMDVASRCRIEPDRLRGQLDRLRARPRPVIRPARRGGERSNVRSGERVVPNEHPDASRDSRIAGVPAPEGGPGPAGPGESAGPPGSAGSAGRNGARRSEREGPAIEVLRHAVHNPEAVSRWLAGALFDDAVHAGAYHALLESDTHAAALATAPPTAAELLARLLVEEPTSEPFDAVRRLLTEVARHEIGTLRLMGATADDPARSLSDVAFLTRAVDDLRDPSAAAGSADRLLAWLGQRVGDGG